MGHIRVAALVVSYISSFRQGLSIASGTIVHLHIGLESNISNISII